MTDLKRKRSSGDPDSAQTACLNTIYLEGVPDSLAELADIKLLVEGHELPMHSYILRESPVLLAAFSTACGDKQRVCQIPLPGERKQHVLLLLKHMYKDSAAILSNPDAQVLATLAHKYSVIRLHKLSEAYLVEHLSLDNATVFDWAELAERLELNLLLAHCERYIILNFHSMSATDKKVSSISQSSLLRIMEGLAVRGADNSDRAPNSVELPGVYLCHGCHELTQNCCFKRSCLVNRIGTTKLPRVSQSLVSALMAAIAPPVETLLRWQQETDDKKQ